MRKGGGRNEQKANERRVANAREREKAVRAKIAALKCIPLNQRQPNYYEDLAKLSGILKQVLRGQKKSETHSRRSKGGAR